MALGLCDCVDGVVEVVDGSGSGLFEEGLELCEGHLDGVEVWTLGRQETEFGVGGFDGPAHAGGLMGWQIVHDDDVVWTSPGTQGPISV